ncbi:MAG TPA: hypothetical protein VGR37_04820, partial [Longimicrobiaceae bacterium]|nr:hypothetical protein [Longimicrobiaceae bacterium]
ALAVAGAYVLLSFAGSQAARRTVAAAEPEAARILAGPAILDPLRRELVVESGGTYRLGRFDLAARTWALDGPAIEKRMGGPGARAAAATPEGSTFLRWARFPYFHAEGDTLRISDARYEGPRGGWASVRIPLPRATSAR